MSDHLQITISLSDDAKQFVQSLAAALQHNLGDKLKSIMSTQADLDTKLDELKQTVSDTGTRIGTGFQAILDKLNAGTAPADLTGEVASVQADIDALKAINVPAA